MMWILGFIWARNRSIDMKTWIMIVANDYYCITRIEKFFYSTNFFFLNT